MGQPNWFIDILRMLFRFIDYVAYWLVDIIYQLFIMISEVGVFSPNTINKFAGRIYALLGIFMLFKVSFSLITYILNPDTFTDKSKGIGKLLTNFFVVLIGIVAVPYIFQAAYGLQGIVLKENVIGNLIMGINAEAGEASGENYIEKGGSVMSFTTLSAFMRLNPNLVGDDCSANPVVTLRDAEGNIIMEDGNPKVELSEACSSSAAMYAMVNNGQSVGELLVDAYKTNNTYYYTITDLVTLKALADDGTEYYVMDYTIIISTVAGGFLAWILLLFCIDIAVRSVKLGFLQLIAPVPIISYVDPKGQGLFQKWLKECGKTYADLFIRLVAIYFVIFIISELGFSGGYYNIVTGEVQGIDSFGALLVRIFIIFGALMFAQQLPGLISNLLGIKFDGGFTLNPMKKLGQSAFAAGLGGAVGGALGGMAANAWATRGNWKGKGFKGAMQNVGSILAGGGSAGFRGMYSGLTSGGKGSLFDGAAKGIKASNQARFNRDVYAGNPAVPGSKYGWGQRRLDDINKFAGVKNKDAGIGQYDKKMKELKRYMENYQGQEHALRDAMAKFMAESRFSVKDFDVSSLYTGGVRKADAAGNYNYVDWNDYINAGGTLDRATFDKFKSFQEGIDHYDAEYEKLRKQYGQYEDAYNARNASKNDKK